MHLVIDDEKIKFKLLTKPQILISLDRLTRFKFTEDKYIRVFGDILTSNLISPKFSKRKLQALSYSELKNYAEYILNASIKKLTNNEPNKIAINNLLLEYEKSVFKQTQESIELLNNRIDFEGALGLFGIEELPQNLQWLKCHSDGLKQVVSREKFSFKFPIEKVVIVEGITEEKLLPEFAKICRYNFDNVGVMLISAGGKNQVVKLFYQLADVLLIPMFVLLDNDAKDNCEEITPKLRKGDKIHILSSGEFEDTLPLNLIKKTLNHEFKNFTSVSIDELRIDKPMTHILADLYKSKGFHEYKKADFADLLAKEISNETEVSNEIIQIITEIKNL